MCIDNTGIDVSLVPRKVYEIVPDAEAAKDEFLRIIDESGEDYLYHSGCFVLVEFPVEVEQALIAA